MSRDLSEVDYVYCWVDGVHFSVRLGDDDRLCVLVMVGVRIDGTKELVAIADGYRESTESWAELLRDAKRRGMRAPVLAIGDGALGFWAAVRDVFPETRWQRDWVHKAANVLNALPASVQPAARRAMREIWDAEDKQHAERALAAFARDFAKWPKAVSKLTADQQALLAFYDFPAEHWIHLRTSNPIESTFAPVRARTDVTKGPGSRQAGMAMCFKLIEAAEGRWRRINAPELVALVRTGAKFVNGRLVERADQEDVA
jgi:transposase-like protein